MSLAALLAELLVLGQTGFILLVALVGFAIGAVLAICLRTVLVVVTHHTASSFAPCSREIKRAAVRTVPAAERQDATNRKRCDEPTDKQRNDEALKPESIIPVHRYKADLAALERAWETI